MRKLVWPLIVLWAILKVLLCIELVYQWWKDR